MKWKEHRAEASVYNFNKYIQKIQLATDVHNTHADECVFYSCSECDIGWLASAFVWPSTLWMSIKKNGTTTEWMGEEKELIKIFFDRFSNLEIIFFSASAGIVAIRWIRRLASSTTFAVYLQSGVLGIEFECLNGLLAFNDSTTHILNSQLLKQREFDSIWIFRLIWITSKGNCPRLYRENRSECEKSVGLPFIGNFHITYQMVV